MKIQVLPDANSVAEAAAKFIAAEARAAVAARGRFIMAVSGGRTPWQMLRALANEEVAWKNVYVVQVDERVAPAGDSDRNLTHLRESLLSHAPLPSEQIHACPSNRRISTERRSSMLRLSAKSPARRRCSTSRTWDLDLTDTRPRSFPVIRSLMSPMRTSRRQVFIRSGGA